MLVITFTYHFRAGRNPEQNQEILDPRFRKDDKKNSPAPTKNPEHCPGFSLTQKPILTKHYCIAGAINNCCLISLKAS